MNVKVNTGELSRSGGSPFQQSSTFVSSCDIQAMMCRIPVCCCSKKDHAGQRRIFRKFLWILPSGFLEDNAMHLQDTGHFSLAVFISAFLM